MLHVQQPVTNGAATAAIPFRQTGPGSEQLLGVMVACVILLALTYAFLRIAKQRGWLERWGVSPQGGAGSDATSIKVLQQKRISQKTAVFVIRHGAIDYVLAETASEIVLLGKVPAEQAQRDD